MAGFNFSGDFKAGLSPDLIDWYNQGVSALGPQSSWLSNPNYGKTFGAEGGQTYLMDPSGRFRITRAEDAGSGGTYKDEYGRDWYVSAGGTHTMGKPPGAGGFRLIDTTQGEGKGAAFDSSGKYISDIDLNKGMDGIEKLVTAGVGGLFGAGALGMLGGGAGAAGAGGAGITGFGDAGLMYGGADAAAAGTLGGGVALPAAAGGTAAMGAAGGVPNLGALMKSGAGGFSWDSLIGPATSLVGGYLNSNASKSAADTLAQAGREAAAQFKPWTDAGGWSIGQAANMLGKNGPEAAKAAFQTSPDYQWRLDQGQNALTKRLSSMGLRNSGAALKAGMDYNQNQASGEFGNSLNRLLAVAGMGQTATNSSTGYSTDAASAAASGRVGSANAWNNALTQGVGMYQQNKLMNRLGVF